jgi:hypothetical protein
MPIFNLKNKTMKKVKDFEYYMKLSTRYWWPVLLAPAVAVIINLIFF